MKRFLAVAALASLLAFPAQAQESKGGLGFRVADSPFALTNLAPASAVPTVALRHWLNPKVGLDAGLGYSQLKFEPSGDEYTGFAFDLGVPISVKKIGDNVNFIFRPGFQWSSLEDKSGTPTVKWTAMAFLGELEVEWMVTDGLSVSAAHGISYNTVSDDGDPKEELTMFGTTGSTFANLGFHVYLW